MKLRDDRFEDLAREIAAREADRAAARGRALDRAGELHEAVKGAIARFAAAAREAGAPHLADLIEVGPIEPDDKSIRAFQIRIRRGRSEAVIVSKDRDEVMLVGPYRRGGDEGPCNPIHLDQGDPEARRLESDLESLVAALIQASFAK